MIRDLLTKQSVEENSETIRLEDNEYIHYDLSKTHITTNDKNLIKNKLMDNEFDQKLIGMLQGKNINYTELRPVLHHLLRDKSVLNEVDTTLRNSKEFKKCKSNDIIEYSKNEIIEELLKMADFTEKFKNMKGLTNQPFDTIVNIGIGGSDLGPRLITDALQMYSKGRKIHFISNIDPTDTVKIFKTINVEKTLFIVVSKTFTTIETMKNFKLALKLAAHKLDEQFSEESICAKHFIAVSSNIDETSKYGIKTVFKMWDFVGGRYSLWSAVGISICLYIGFENFFKLLRGASQVDQDFFDRKLDSIPARMAINELYYISKGYNNKCIVSYDGYLSLFYKYLQQAEMESNGKHGSKQMIIWGGVGTDVQHSFFQLLHQGEQNIYLEFLCPLNSVAENDINEAISDNKVLIQENHQLLVASCLAQSRSMLIGKESKDKNHYFSGDKPSVTILYSRLTPDVLGALLAAYEHKIFITGVYFGINSYDQFGVELGKALTTELLQEIKGEESKDKKSVELDPSTEKLISFIKK